MNYRRSFLYQYGDFSGLIIMSNYRVTCEKGLSLLSFQRLSWKVLCWMGSLSRGTWMLECGLLATKALAPFLVLREMQRTGYLPFSLLNLLYYPAHPLSSLSDLLSPISPSFPLLSHTSHPSCSLAWLIMNEVDHLSILSPFVVAQQKISNLSWDLKIILWLCGDHSGTVCWFKGRGFVWRPKLKGHELRRRSRTEVDWERAKSPELPSQPKDDASISFWLFLKLAWAKLRSLCRPPSQKKISTSFLPAALT